MGVILLGIVSLIYLGVAVNMAVTGQPAMSLVFFAYAVDNVGLIWAAY